MVSSLDELDDLCATVDHAAVLVPGGERIKRGHTNGPIRVALPDGYLDDADSPSPRRVRRHGVVGWLSACEATAGARPPGSRRRMGVGRMPPRGG
ncbi:MAG: hypothetical protein WKF45_07040 [Ilumatobacteraceae bacterium]